MRSRLTRVSLAPTDPIDECSPLGITDISYVPSSRKISMAHGPPPYTFDSTIPPRAKFDSGGTGLFGSALSYLRILRAILGGGQLDGARILRPDTVDLMFQGHLSDDELDPSTQLDDLEQFGTFADPFWFGSERQLPGAVDWGLGGMLTGLVEGCYSHGREAGTMTWTGKAVSRAHASLPRLMLTSDSSSLPRPLRRSLHDTQNTFWVIDRQKDLAYVCFTNMLPNLAAPAFRCWKEVEVLLYAGMGKA